jgi:8-oxo-dGTP diphosphatase
LIILAADGAVLLQRFSDDVRSWWVCPGGGLEGDETAEQGAIREAREELGLEIDAVGPDVWQRRHVFEWQGRLLDQRERFFVLRVEERFEPMPQIGPEALLAEGVREHRWWTVDEIDAYTDGDFAPEELASLVRELIADVG